MVLVLCVQRVPYSISWLLVIASIYMEHFSPHSTVTFDMITLYWCTKYKIAPSCHIVYYRSVSSPSSISPMHMVCIHWCSHFKSARRWSTMVHPNNDTLLAVHYKHIDHLKRSIPPPSGWPSSCVVGASGRRKTRR